MQSPCAVSAFAIIVFLFLVLSFRSNGVPAVSQESALMWSDSHLSLRPTRSSPLDLEIALPGRIQFVSREDLLSLSQESFTVSDDANFTGAADIRGVSLDALMRALGVSTNETMVVAVCADLYRGHYTKQYIQAHHPVLVLEVNGQPPEGWPKSKESAYMGPYLISHSHFTPSFKVLAHPDEPQIPWGVVRLEFHSETGLLNSIEPHGPLALDPLVQDGFRIAQQNCWRCHGTEREGPRKGKLTWEGIALFAATAPRNFANYVRNPQQVSAAAKMPANLEYDEATLQALTAYFHTFFRKDKS